jgi:GTP-binding protein HflX
LFATLDPTVRQVKLSGIGEVVLADTVGFVRELPHELIAAFRSTLQEARDADLLLHVVDASDPLRNERVRQVREVLGGIGAGAIRELLVFNKIDLTGAAAADTTDAKVTAGVEMPRVVAGADGVPAQAWVSAATGDGLQELRQAIAQTVRPHQVRRTLHLGMLAAAVRSDLYRRNAVRAERQCDDGSWELDVELDLAELAKLRGAPGVDLVEHNDARREQRVA